MSQNTQDPALQVVSINDFSSGIHQYGRNYATAVPAINAPVGSAFNSYNCINQPGVGLIALPRYNSNKSPVQFTTGLATELGYTVCISDIVCLGPYGQTRFNPLGATPDVLYFGYGFYNQAPSTSNSYVQGVGKISAFTTSPYTHSNYYSVESLQSFNFTASGVSISKTRYNYTDADGNVYSVPAIVAVGRLVGEAGDGSAAIIGPYQNEDGSSLDFNTISFPSLTFPSQKGPYSYYALTHEFRIIFFTQVNEYYDGQNPTTATPPLLLTNEDIYYTDPPGTFDYLTLTDFAIPNFDTEDVNGWGAWGSVSTGELFLVRNSQGGLVISGDLAVPSVTKLPAVNGTGGIFQTSPISPAGMVYLSEMDGAYVWNGGNTSSKISESIPDDALQRPDYSLIGTGPNAQNVAWGNWVLFANNWLYDSSQGSWWKLDNPSTNPITVWGNSCSARYVWGAKGEQGNGANTTQTLNFYAYDKFVSASSYYWQSNPIPVTVGNLTNVELIEIVASNPSNTACTITIQCVGLSNYNAQAIVFNIPSSASGIRLSQRCAYENYNIQISVTATNSNANNAAPTLHSIDVGYNIASPTSTT